MLFVIIENNNQMHNYLLKDSGIGLNLEVMSADLKLQLLPLPMSYNFSLRLTLNDYSLPFVWFEKDELFIQFKSGNRCVVSIKSFSDNTNQVLIKRNIIDKFAYLSLSSSDSNTLNEIIYRLKADAYI